MPDLKHRRIPKLSDRVKAATLDLYQKGELAIQDIADSVGISVRSVHRIVAAHRRDHDPDSPTSPEGRV